MDSQPDLAAADQLADAVVPHPAPPADLLKPDFTEALPAFRSSSRLAGCPPGLWVMLQQVVRPSTRCNG